MMGKATIMNNSRIINKARGLINSYSRIQQMNGTINSVVEFKVLILSCRY